MLWTQALLGHANADLHFCIDFLQYGVLIAIFKVVEQNYGDAVLYLLLLKS